MATKILTEVKNILASTMRHLANEDPRKTIWQRVEEKAKKSGLNLESKAFRETNAELFLGLATLKVLCRRYFKIKNKNTTPS